MLSTRPLKTIAAGAIAALLCACANQADPAPAQPAGNSTPASAVAVPQPARPAALSSAPAAATPPQPVATGNAAIVERLPQVLACTPTPRARLMGSGPGQELFSVICANGYGLLVQCVAGACKVMN